MRSSSVRLVLATVGAVCMAGAVAVLGQAPGQAPASPPPAAPATPPAPGQAPAAPDDQPVFRAGVNFVRVDAIVTDKQGNPVTDLTQDDFEVIEDDKRQTIDTFRLVKIDTQAAVETPGRLTTRQDEENAAADEDARIFVFFLDEYHVRLGNSMAARKHLIDFVQTQLGPKDLVSVMYPLSPLDSVILTRDHRQLVNAIDRFQGRKFDYTPRNALEDRYANQPTEVVERIRRQVSLSALTGLSVKLGALREGRKAIVLVSEGYLAMLPPQLRGAMATMPGLGNPNRNNPLAGENDFQEDRARFTGELDVQRELQRVFEEANRSNTAIYAVDPRGLSTGEFDIQDNVAGRASQDALRQTQNTLQVLAGETDGRAIINRNDLAVGMKQIVRDSSAYYLIGYNSTQSRSDGKFHPIKVRVRRPGLQVRARKGYWAMTAVETARATAPPKPGPPPAIARSLAGITASADRRLIRTWVGTAPADGGRTQVTVVWEGIPPAPGAQRALVGRVMLTAAAPSGEQYFKGQVGADAPADAPASARRGAVTFEVPPGKVSLRMSIEEKPDEVLDTDDRTIEVPDFTEPKARLTTPRVYVARTPREFQTIKNDAAAAPTATREFRRTERLFLRLDAVAPGGQAGALAYSARLLNRQGDRMADLPVTPPAVGGAATLDVPLASLPAGEFLIEIAARGPDGADATELVAFRMVG
ncbi:MAG: VWA domain-containing protein [Acidobacteria bacterium]|nr:VWA domain-containing protein [Acidobacteriota bacterium]